ncbi:unnamed protein product [Prunus brigantina]
MIFPTTKSCYHQRSKSQPPHSVMSSQRKSNPQLPTKIKSNLTIPLTYIEQRTMNSNLS